MFNIIVYFYVVFGFYNIMFRVWNLMYMYFYSKMIRIEYFIFIGSLFIFLIIEYIFYFDGKVILILYYLLMNQDFISVKCKFNYGDGEEMFVVNLINNFLVEWIYFYEVLGIMNVVFMCINGIFE